MEQPKSPVSEPGKKVIAEILAGTSGEVQQTA
jgi:hypothetical protein